MQKRIKQKKSNDIICKSIQLSRLFLNYMHLRIKWRFRVLLSKN